MAWVRHTHAHFWQVQTSELYIFDIWNDNFSHSIGKKMKHWYQSFTRIGRQFQSLERQVYADWTGFYHQWILLTHRRSLSVPANRQRVEI